MLVSVLCHLLVVAVSQSESQTNYLSLSLLIKETDNRHLTVNNFHNSLALRALSELFRHSKTFEYKTADEVCHASLLQNANEIIEKFVDDLP